MKRNTELQGLRAVAVIFVLLAHAELEMFSGGFVGVDIFFVLSGFFITGLLSREIETTGRIQFAAFFAKRIKRLLPVLLLVLAVSYVLMTFILSSYEAEKLLSSSPFAPLWVSNLYFYFSSFGYFDELSGKDAFLHTWSLAVEEQFYLLWPLLILAIYKIYSRSAAINNSFWSSPVSLLLLVSFASFGLSIYWSLANIDAAFYLMPSRIWQFSLGGIAYHFLRSYAVRENQAATLFIRKNAFALFVSGIVMVTGCLLLLDDTYRYPGFWALLPSLGTFLIILSSEGLIAGQSNLLANKPLVVIGDRSYSIYLWHWPIFVLGEALGLDSIPLLILLTFGLSFLSYSLIEYPIWKGRFSKTRPFWTIFVGIAASLVLSMSFFRGVVELQTQVQNDSFYHQIRSDMPIIYAMGCDQWYSSDQLKPCLVGDMAGQKLAVFVGDSIGAQWISALSEYYTEKGWKLLVMTKSACPIVDEEMFYERIRQVYTVCETWRNSVINYLHELKPDIAIIGSASTYNFSPEQWFDGSVRAIQNISESSEKVFLIPGTPSLGFDGPGCLRRKEIFRRCDSTQSNSGIRFVNTILMRVTEQFENVSFLDLNDLVCLGYLCSAASDDGITIFRDSQHLSDTFVKSTAKDISTRLDEISADTNSE